MTPYKTERVNHRRAYYVHLEIGLVLALVIVVLAFQLRWSPQEKFQVTLEQQEVVHLEEVTQTEQKAEAPLPPSPAPPVAVPDNQVLEQDELDFDASLNLDRALEVSKEPPPPPKKDPDTAPKQEEAEVFVAVESQPDCGGLSSLQENIDYPDMARQAGIQGTVYVQFIVSETGTVTERTVLRSTHPILEEAALTAVRDLTCTPGRQRGTPVKVLMTLPVEFRLSQQ